MSDYEIALGTNTTHLREDVNRLLKLGYQLAGSLVIMVVKDNNEESGEYFMFYQSMIKVD